MYTNRAGPVGAETFVAPHAPLETPLTKSVTPAWPSTGSTCATLPPDACV
jgi:hypothetical protein